MFDRYNFLKGLRHGSIDGSKHGAKRPTAKCRHSAKYFGLEKGIVALNMVLNSVPVNSKIIGANDYEGHFTYDMCFNNSSGVQPDVLSTDTAGSNPVNFLMLDLIDIQFAPCYKNFSTKIKTLSGFKLLDKYKDLLIKPKRQVKKNLILGHWSDMQPILAALLMKETTQNIVVKKLSSKGNQSKLKKAFWEYNNILFSIYMLRYIDEPILRQAVRLSLNRGELFHKLYNAVAKIGGKKFRGMSDLEIAIWHQCTHLITLVIIYYNMYLLSELVERKLAENNKELAKLLERISPLAIRHINLGGVYNYSDDTDEGIDIDSLVNTMDKAIEEFSADKKRKK